MLASEAFADLVARYGRQRVREAARVAADELRRELAKRAAAGDPPEAAGYGRPVRLAAVARRWLAASDAPSLRRVVNATGVVIHTNLGRAPLSEAATEAMVRVASGYSNLEYELATGVRGSRYGHCADLVRELTGAEEALVVNNAAAALALAANTMAGGGGVVVSRGELIEIGGGFRIEEMLLSAGVRPIEVGSANRTRVGDYAYGLRVPGAKAVLKVHRSNFRMSGFAEEAGLSELAELAAEHGVPLLHDLGSGLVSRGSVPAIGDEPTPGDSLAGGAAVAVFSGDKLLGGPQAGIACGARSWIARMRSNPLCRALRVDKTTLAALEATLRIHRGAESIRGRIPVLRMLAESPKVLESRARRIASGLARAGVAAEVVDGVGLVGGGSCPDAELPGAVVRLTPSAGSSRELAERLRKGDPPVIARVAEDRLVLDPRTVSPSEDRVLTACVARATGAPGR